MTAPMDAATGRACRSAIAAAKRQTSPQLSPEDWYSEACWRAAVPPAAGPAPGGGAELAAGPLDPSLPLLLRPELISFAEEPWRSFPSPEGLAALIPDYSLVLAATDNDGGAVTVGLPFAIRSQYRFRNRVTKYASLFMRHNVDKRWCKAAMRLTLGDRAVC